MRQRGVIDVTSEQHGPRSLRVLLSLGPFRAFAGAQRRQCVDSRLEEGHVRDAVNLVRRVDGRGPPLAKWVATMSSQSPSFEPALASNYPKVTLSVIRSLKPSATLPPGPVAPRRILVADGNDARRARTAEALSVDGFVVHEQGDRDGVYGDALAFAPDVVLLDAAWLDVCRDLRAADLSRITPILLIGSASDEEDVVVRGLDAGADDYIAGASRIGELRARVRAQLRHRRDRELLEWAREQRSSFRELALTDPLTGIGNRRRGLRAIERAASLGQSLTVVLIDLDHFKRVNDTFGHEMGDVVLRRVATALERENVFNATVCRWGGEEFAIIVTDAESDESASLGERYRAAIADILFADPQAPSGVTGSLGVAHTDGRTGVCAATDLLKAADDAMYESKHAGRNRVTLAAGVSAARSAEAR